MKIRRSTIEVPGNVQKMVEKCFTFDTDSLMLDLEDSVPRTDAAKADARRTIAEALARGGFRAREVMVRVNPPDSPWFRDDVNWLARQQVPTVVVPKVYSEREYAYVEGQLDASGIPDTVAVQLIVETPGCLLELENIVGNARRIDGIVSGGWDYTLECGSSAMLRLGGTSQPLHQGHLDYLRHKTVAVAAAFGITAVDGLLTANVKDSEEVRQAASTAKLTGFDGCMVIYPPHVAICNEVFAPTADELIWASSVIGTYEASVEEGRGAAALNGVPILPQHYAIAKELVAVTERLSA